MPPTISSRRARSASSPRSKRRAPPATTTVSAPLPSKKPPPSPVKPVPVELLSDDEGTLMLPVKFQCPLCLDVLRSPIQLPCCSRHLCTECFERALDLTSSNCGFCRKRIVGFARKKQYKVDETLWTEIRRCCPFVAHANGAADSIVDIEFVDENARPRRCSRGGGADTEPIPSDIVRLAEVTTDSQPPPIATATTATIVPDDPPPSIMVTRKMTQQGNLDSFFGVTRDANSRPSSAGSMRSLRSTSSSSSSSNSSLSSLSNRRGRRRPDPVGKRPSLVTTKPLLRSASHSPKRRRSETVQRTLLQLTLNSPLGRITRQSSSSSHAANGDVVTTRSRRSWRCIHCTFENNCFATQCSMCHEPLQL